MTQEAKIGMETPEASWGAAAVAAARLEFDGEGIYLNTASSGLPTRRSQEALQKVLTQWRVGRAKAPEHDRSLNAARSSYAAMVRVEPCTVAVGSQVSVFVGQVAASLPDGCEVLTLAGEFTSVTFPFLTQAGRGVTVREVPLERLAESVTADTTLVAASAVQSADGRLADLEPSPRQPARLVHGSCWTPRRPWDGYRWTRAASLTQSAPATSGCSHHGAPASSLSSLS